MPEDSSPSASSDFSLSTLSLSSEDWDRSLNLSDCESGAESPEDAPSSSLRQNLADTTTPRNSVIFPANASGHNDETPNRANGTPRGTKGKRSLSDLLRLHAEKGTAVKFSVEEAARIADVLNSWVNTSPSPYEDEDDFFARSQDDLSLLSANKPTSKSSSRSRGQSESANSRPPSAAGSFRS